MQKLYAKCRRGRPEASWKSSRSVSAPAQLVDSTLSDFGSS